MKLFELFKGETLDWKWVTKKHNLFAATARTEQDQPLSVFFQRQLATDFVRDLPEEMVQDHPEMKENPTLWYMMFEVSYEQGITGSGEAYTIFTTVFEIVDDFVKNTQPNALMFSADEPSRQKLYDRMVKKYATQFDTYALEPSGYRKMKYYWLVKR